MRKGQTVWGLTLEFFDEEVYRSLNKSDQRDVAQFRDKYKYIVQHQQRIERLQKQVNKLKTEISERQEKIRIHKLEGKKLYERVEYLKSEIDVDVYYTESNRKSRRIDSAGKKKVYEYPQTNLKYKSKHLSNSKSISLKTTRDQTLKVLNNHFPSVFTDDVVSKCRNNKNRMNRTVVEFFKPVIRDVISKHKADIRNSVYRLTFDQLIEETKTRITTK